MSLINLVLVLIVIGVLLYLVKRAPFIDAEIKVIIQWVVIVAIVLWLLFMFLPMLGIPDIYIGGRK